MFVSSAPQRAPMVGAITYLLLSFPLGLTYFLVIVIGFSFSLGTLIIWIGVPLLCVTLYAVHGMAELERRITARLFNDPLPLQAPDGLRFQLEVFRHAQSLHPEQLALLGRRHHA